MPIFKEGYVQWKFIFSDTVKYRLRNKDAIALFDYIVADYKEPFDIYTTLNRQTGWHFVCHYERTERCACGSSFTESNNGEDFRIRRPGSAIQSTKKEGTIEYFHLPEICQLCYFKAEFKDGLWVPKFIKKQLGIEE